MPESLSPRDKPGESPPDRKAAQHNRREIFKYAGLATQIFLAVGLTLFAGIKSDKWIGTSFPIFAWALPLLVIVVLIVKLIKETSGHGGRD